MSYAHAESLCLGRAKPHPIYRLTPGMHYTSGEGTDWNDGDRTDRMTCVNCGALMWGHYKIEEEP